MSEASLSGMPQSVIFVTHIIVALLIPATNASHTGYGEGVIQKQAETFSCSFTSRTYTGSYYFQSTSKVDDSIIETCMDTCMDVLTVDHTPFDLSFESTSPAPSPSVVESNPYNSLQVFDDDGEFICNCPKGSGVPDETSISTPWWVASVLPCVVIHFAHLQIVQHETKLQHFWFCNES